MFEYCKFKSKPDMYGKLTFLGVFESTVELCLLRDRTTFRRGRLCLGLDHERVDCYRRLVKTNLGNLARQSRCIPSYDILTLAFDEEFEFLGEGGAHVHRSWS